MHRSLCLLLLVLLALRGWVGEAVAGQVLQARLAAGTPHAEAVHGAAARQDCHAAAPGPSGGAALAEATAPDDEVGCAACQGCFAIALTATAPTAPMNALAHAPPRAAPHALFSAERERAFKPPIS